MRMLLCCESGYDCTVMMRSDLNCAWLDLTLITCNRLLCQKFLNITKHLKLDQVG